MGWHQCIGLPPHWSTLKQQLGDDGGESDLVIQITDNCDGETTIYWHDEGHALATWTPQRHIVLSRMQSSKAVSLAESLSDQALPGISGHLPEVQTFAKTWVNKVQGRSKRLDQTLVLYDLPQLMTPRPCVGEAKICKRSDLEHVHQWVVAFHRETNPKAPVPKRVSIDTGLARGTYWYWMVDQQPVCLVGLRWITAHTSRIAPVFTPIQERKRGYASSLVHHVAQYGSSHGRCTLFADQDNLASNAVYQALGFRPGPVFQRWTFDEGEP